MITVLQIVIIIFALFAWSRVFLRMRDKAVSPGMFVFWSIVWIGIILVALFPTIITSLSTAVGIGRGVDFAVYISIIVLFYLMFRLYVRIDSQNQEITKLTREIAIRNSKKKR